MSFRYNGMVFLKTNPTRLYTIIATHDFMNYLLRDISSKAITTGTADNVIDA